MLAAPHSSTARPLPTANAPTTAFPKKNLPGLFISHNALVIGFCANHYHEVGMPNLFLHPARPAFSRRHELLIDDAIDAVRPEAVGQLQNVLRVLRRVVTVADENFRRHKSHVFLEDFLCDLSKFVRLKPHPIRYLG